MLMEKVEKIFSKVRLCSSQDGGLQLWPGIGWSSGWLDYRGNRQRVDGPDRRSGERFNGPDKVVPFELYVEWGGVDDGHLACSIVLDVDQSWTADHESRAIQSMLIGVITFQN